MRVGVIQYAFSRRAELIAKEKQNMAASRGRQTRSAKDKAGRVFCVRIEGGKAENAVMRWRCCYNWRKIRAQAGKAAGIYLCMSKEMKGKRGGRRGREL